MDGLPESQAQVDTTIEVSAANWAPIPPKAGDTAVTDMLFVDGVRRIDARIWIDDLAGGESRREPVSRRYLRDGQTCHASTRILAPRARYRQIVDAITDTVRALRVGDPLQEDTQIGPLVSAAQRDRVLGFIEAGRRTAARITPAGRYQPIRHAVSMSHQRYSPMWTIHR
jgi:Aldehyde dehydrogenase family